jgi:subtilisin family serine protease
LLCSQARRSRARGMKGRPPESGTIEHNVFETRTATQAEAADFERDGRVKLVAETMPIRLIQSVSDPDSIYKEDPVITRNAAWGIDAVGAIDSPYDGSSAVVAILDTGIQAKHAAFKGISFASRDFTGEGINESDVADTNGHGTHCAGTIFGRTVKGTRIGVAPGVKRAIVGKIFGSKTNANTGTLVRAIQWAREQGANVISMSLGFDFAGMAARLEHEFGMPPRAAFAQVSVEFQRNLRIFDLLFARISGGQTFEGDNGAVLVAAAGNDSRRLASLSGRSYTVPATIPSNAAEVIATGALRMNQERLEAADFSNTSISNRGSFVVAPGVRTISAAHDTFDSLTEMNGTSMACPHVAGVAALWWDAVRAGPLEAVGSTVKTQLLAACDYKRFGEEFQPVDLGLGLCQAPVTGNFRRRKA